MNRGGFDGLVGGGPPMGFLAIAADEVNRIVIHDTQRHAGDHDGGHIQRDVEPPHDAKHGQYREQIRWNGQQPEPPRPEHDEDDGEHRQKRHGKARNLRSNEVMVERTEQAPGAGHRRRDPGARKDRLRQAVGLGDLHKHEIGTHRRELDGDLGPRIIRRHHTIEFGPAFVTQPEHQKLLSHFLGRRRYGVCLRPAVVQFAVHTFDVVRQRRHLLHVRQRLQLRRELIHPGQHIRTL